MTVTVGSLCSGYGGLDLGLALALGQPVNTLWHVEYDKHPSAILAHNHPNTPNYGDVTSLDYATIPAVEWLTAGYPCQPFSNAGSRKGANDHRHLWPHVARTISELRPENVLLENVRGHVSLGLDAVIGDLSALGYDARWTVVRASDIGAPHERARLFIVATDTRRQRHGSGQNGSPLGRVELDSDNPGTGDGPHDESRPVLEHRNAAATPNAGSGPLAGLEAARDGLRLPAERRYEPAPAAASPGLEGRRRFPVAAGASQPADDCPTDWGAYGPAIARWERVLGRPAPEPTQPAKNGDRLSPAFVEWMMGLSAGWVTGTPGLSLVSQLKALGNGVVPQQAAYALNVLGIGHSA